VCDRRAARSCRRALRTGDGLPRAVVTNEHDYRAPADQATAALPGPGITPTPATACRAASAAAGQWLQFWLQFTTVRAIPGKYATQVTDFPEHA